MSMAGKLRGKPRIKQYYVAKSAESGGFFGKKKLRRVGSGGVFVNVVVGKAGGMQTRVIQGVTVPVTSYPDDSPRRVVFRGRVDALMRERAEEDKDEAEGATDSELEALAYELAAHEAAHNFDCLATAAGSLAASLEAFRAALREPL
jgi:hypothetical protein